MKELYESIYDDLKSYIDTNSIYKPKVAKRKPNEISSFPLVTCEEGESDYQYTTLKYTDETYRFNIKINIFAQNKTVDGNVISGMTICDEIRNHIEKFFKYNYRMSVRVTPNAPNVDDSIFRTFINVNSKLDTKYKNKLVIYPN